MQFKNGKAVSGKRNVFEAGKLSAFFCKLNGSLGPIGQIAHRLQRIRASGSRQFAPFDRAEIQHIHHVVVPVGINEVARPKNNGLYSRSTIGIFHIDTDPALDCVWALRRGF
jgi:hypothetical protein